MPTGVEAEEDLHELLRAANFLTLHECVQTVVARVVAEMLPVRRLIWLVLHQSQQRLVLHQSQHCSRRAAQENAAPWLLFAEEGTLGEFDDMLKMNALGCLLAAIGIVPPGNAGPPKCLISPEAMALLRSALQRCTAQELVRLRLSFLRVTPGDADASAWVIGAEPLLMSPRSPARRPVTFINLRPSPIDVLWIGFDGDERRYTKANDNVDSKILPGRSTSWSSVVGHMWRVRSLPRTPLPHAPPSRLPDIFLARRSMMPTAASGWARWRWSCPPRRCRRRWCRWTSCCAACS